MKFRYMHEFLQILSVGKHCNRRTQYSVYSFPFLVSKMERSKNEGYFGVLPKKKPKPEPEENKLMFRVLLHNGLNLTLQLEDVVEKMLVIEFVRSVRRKVEK